MGNNRSKTELSPKLKEKVINIFRLMDVDGSKTIDLEETIKFWSKNFARINSSEMFAAVDKNHDGTIEESEWLAFWVKVKDAGHTEEEIILELDSLEKGEAWVKFNDIE